jgi:hypothetical protein
MIPGINLDEVLHTGNMSIMSKALQPSTLLS